MFVTFGRRDARTASCMAIVLGSIAGGCGSTATAGGTLSLIDLGAGVSAYGINASGTVTGCAPAAGGTVHAFVYSAGIMTDLGTLGGSGSCGYAINASGQITGYADTATASHAFVFSGGVMTDIGTVGGVATSAGTAINAHGDVVGYASPNAPFAPLAQSAVYNAALQVVDVFAPQPTAHAFLYHDGVATDLAPPDTTLAPYFALAINDSGLIGLDMAGLCGILCPTGVASTLSNGTQTTLPDLNGVDGNVFFTVIAGINNAGQIVAYGEDPDAYTHGVIYTNGVPLDLGLNTEAFGINANGDVVGMKLGNSAIGLYGVTAPDETPFLYSNGVKTDLTLPGAIPVGINDSGWIIANHLTLNHAYVLEPSDISLAPFGLSFGTIPVEKNGTGAKYDCGSCVVTLTNGSAAAISVSSPVIDGPFTQSSNCGTTLAPAAACNITVAFNSSTLGTSLGALTVGAGGVQYATLLGGHRTIEARLSASTTKATVNEPFTVSWAASPGSTCNAGGYTGFSGAVSATGTASITVTSAQTDTFTLDCTQGGESAQAKLEVIVSPPPPHGGGGAVDMVSLGALLTLCRLRRRATVRV